MEIVLKKPNVSYHVLQLNGDNAALIEWLERDVIEKNDDGEEYSYQQESSEYKLGYILLKIMETVTYIKKYGLVPGKKASKQLSKVNALVEELRREVFLSKNDLDLFDNYLIWTFLDSLEFRPISNIYEYLLVCINNPKYFNESDLVYLSIVFLHSFVNPTIINSSDALDEKRSILLNRTLIDSNFILDKLDHHNNSPYPVAAYSYSISSLMQFCFSSLYEIIRAGFMLKQCLHCDKWFIEYSKNEKYCDGLSPLNIGLTCKEAARKEKEKTRMSRDLQKILKSRHQYYADRITFANTPKETEERTREKEAFKKSVKEWQKKVRAKDATEEEFKKWIKTTYIRKYKNKGG